MISLKHAFAHKRFNLENIRKSLIEKEQLFLGDAVNWKTITIFFCLIRTKGHYIDRHMATSFFYYTKRFFNKYTHALQYYSDRFSGRPSMKCL